MRYSISIGPFKIHDSDPDDGEPNEVFLNDMWLIYTGNTPEGISPEILMPTTTKEAKELAEVHDMSIIGQGLKFTMYLTDYDKWEFPHQAHFEIDNKQDIIAFELPKGSNLKVITIEQLCEINRYDYHELKANCNKSIWERINAA